MSETVFISIFILVSHQIEVQNVATPTKPVLSVRKLFYRFVDAENAEILSSKMIYSVSQNKGSPNKKKYLKYLYLFMGKFF